MKKLEKIASKFFDEVYGETDLEVQIIFNFRCTDASYTHFSKNIKEKVSKAFKEGLDQFEAGKSNEG